MADQKIIIDIVNHVNIKSSTQRTPSENLQLQNPVRKDTVISSTTTAQGSNKWDSVISAGFISSKSKQVLSIVGNVSNNQSFNQAGNAIANLSKYGLLIAGTLSGNYLAALELGISAVSDISKLILKEVRESAQEKNSIDELRISLGLMDISGVHIKRNSITYRYDYSTK